MVNSCPKRKFPYRPPTPRGRARARVNFRALDTDEETLALGREGDESLDPELIIAEYAETVLHEDPNDPYCIESEYEDCEEDEEDEEFEEEDEEEETWEEEEEDEEEEDPEI